MYLWYIRYLHMIAMVYVWLSTWTYAGMCIYTYTLPCQPVAYYDPLWKILFAGARFDYAKAHGSWKAQDGKGGTTCLLCREASLERQRTSLWSFEFPVTGQNRSLAHLEWSLAGSSSCSCWWPRAMHNSASRTWTQLKLLARRRSTSNIASELSSLKS